MFFDLLVGRVPQIEETKSAADVLYNTLDFMYELGYKDKIKLDFSIINDLDYYNGTVFNGFIDGIPKVILSGGRYDGLVEKFGAKVDAEGFAIYLDDLLYLDESSEYDVDVLLVYDENASPVEVLKKAEKIISTGESVRMDSRVPSDIKFKRKETL